METYIERCERLWGFDGTIEGAKAAIDDMMERYYKPMEIARQQYEDAIKETERMQEVIDGFRLSKDMRAWG